jgi:hypothetical protein
MAEHAMRLRPIKDGGRILGLAALSTDVVQSRRKFAKVYTVGGLASTISQSDLSTFVGSIDYEPTSAKREPATYLASGQAALEVWASEQKGLLPSWKVNPLAWCVATCSLADLQCDPIDIAAMLVRDGDTYTSVTADEMVDLIQTRGVAFYQSHLLEHVETYHSQACFGGMPTFWPLFNSSFLSLQRDKDGQPNKTSVLSCLERRALARGLKLEATYAPVTPLSHFGKMRVLILLAKENS